jgi:hypothetical protein
LDHDGSGDARSNSSSERGLKNHPLGVAPQDLDFADPDVSEQIGEYVKRVFHEANQLKKRPPPPDD